MPHHLLTLVPNAFHEHLQSVCGCDAQLVGGVGEFHSIFVNGEVDEEIIVAGMALGDDSFSCHILVISKDKSEITTSLEDLAMQVQTADVKNMACFLCSYFGGGIDFHEAKSVESQLVQRAFPGIPICGFFGQGAIGTHQFSSQKSDELLTPLESAPNRPRIKGKENLVHFLTSAYGFMLIQAAGQSTSSP